MKAIKIILGTLAALAIVFFGIGLLSDSITYTTEIETSKPLKESWAVFMDQSKAAQWLTGLKSMELISGDGHEVGSVYKITMEENGQVMEMTEEVTDIRENELYAMKFDNQMFTSQITVHFTAKDGSSTAIRSESEVQGKNVIWRALFALTKSHFIKSDQEIYANLQRVIEENTTDYFPAAEAGVSEE